MSGIVASFGNPKLSEIQQMQETIKYRGKYNSGIFQKENVVLGQNYFEVDKGRKGSIKVITPCYIRRIIKFCPGNTDKTQN